MTLSGDSGVPLNTFVDVRERCLTVSLRTMKARSETSTAEHNQSRIIVGSLIEQSL